MGNNNDAIKEAEQRGYSRGYSAGRIRGRRDTLNQPLNDQQFLDAALLATLPVCIEVKGWNNGKGEPITSLPARTELAMKFAKEALRQRRRNPA